MCIPTQLHTSVRYQGTLTWAQHPLPASPPPPLHLHPWAAAAAALHCAAHATAGAAAAVGVAAAVAASAAAGHRLCPACCAVRGAPAVLPAVMGRRTVPTCQAGLQQADGHQTAAKRPKMPIRGLNTVKDSVEACIVNTLTWPVPNSNQQAQGPAWSKRCCGLVCTHANRIVSTAVPLPTTLHQHAGHAHLACRAL